MYKAIHVLLIPRFVIDLTFFHQIFLTFISLDFYSQAINHSMNRFNNVFNLLYFYTFNKIDSYFEY